MEATTTALPHAPRPQVVAHEVRPEATGWTSWFTTVDHKKIGILYIVTAFVFFLVGGTEALLMRIQLGVPDNTFLEPATYNQILTMHGTTMVFLFVVPMMTGFANYIVPLQIGARDMAFPRLNALSYWLFLGGAIVFYSSLFFAPPEAGWTSYTPLSAEAYSPSGGIDAWIFLIHLTGISSIIGAINLYVTIANMRAPGMGWSRLPLFCWAVLSFAILLILALPSVAAGVTLLLTDRHFGTHFYDPTQGGSPLLWQHLFWFFGHPEVYIMVLPGFGIISEVLPVFSRKPIFGYRAIAVATIGIAFLSLLVWAHHMFTTPISTVVLAFFFLSSVVIAVPTGVKVFNWIATLWRGTLVMKTPLYFAVGFVSLFTIGGISGVMLAIFPIDWQVHDTYFVVAHFHYVLVAGAVNAILCGLYYWFPKMTGRMLSEGLGKLSLLADLHRVQRHLPRPALPRPRRDAATDLRVLLGQRLGHAQPDLDDRLVHPRRRSARHRDQRPAQRQEGPARGTRPVEGQHAGVVRRVAASAQQLRRRPLRPLRRADEGHPPPDRAGHRGRAAPA